ncbi:MAG: DUF2147 domain-containing protein [Bacteroidota bacterium]
MMRALCTTCLFVMHQFGFAQVQADDLLGTYWTEQRTGKIEIFKEGGKYFGRILWREEPRQDTENPDRSLRNRSVVGITFLKDFVFDGEEEWGGGEVYSIANGGTYSGKIWLEDEGQVLKMRGYMGFSLLGKTMTLMRVDD